MELAVDMLVVLQQVVVGAEFHQTDGDIMVGAGLVLEVEGVVGDALHQMFERGKFAGRQSVLCGAQSPPQQAGAWTAQLLQQSLDIGQGDMIAQGVGSGIFQVMGFVDDQVAIVRQHPVSCRHVG